MQAICVKLANFSWDSYFRKGAKFRLRVLNVQVPHLQVGLMHMQNSASRNPRDRLRTIT